MLPLMRTICIACTQHELLQIQLGFMQLEKKRIHYLMVVAHRDDTSVKGQPHVAHGLDLAC